MPLLLIFNPITAQLYTLRQLNMKYLAFLKKHLPALILVVVAVLNVLIKDKSIRLTDAWSDSLNVILAALGVAAHLNNQ